MTTHDLEQKPIPPVFSGSGLAEDVLGIRVDGSSPDRLLTFADALNESSAAPVERLRRIETWVTFSLGGETFGVPVTHVHEILRVAGITRVPHAPATVRGVTNMRGRVLPVVDLRVRLGMPAAETTVQSRIIVVTSRGRSLGLLVDGVDQVERIDRDAVQAPPSDVMTAQSDYILGVSHAGSQLVILLDVDLILVLRETERDAQRAAHGE